MTRSLSVILCLLWGVILSGPAQGLIGPVEIGVLSHRGDRITVETWSPTAKYLSSAIPEYRFEIVPLDFDEVNPAVESGEVDFVLVNPGIPLATAAVFAARDGAFSEPVDWPGVAPDAASLAAWLAARGNDLEAPARRLAPVVDRVLEVLSEQPLVLLARMSGSGATCFGLFAKAEAARAAAEEIARRHGDWWVAAAPLLHGDPDRQPGP